MEDLFGNKKLMALSWKQPFAALMLPPFDKIETRVWKTDYRGPVLICASKKGYSLQQILDIAGKEQYNRIIETFREVDLTGGNAIAIGDLVHCRKMLKADEDKCFVQHFPDLWCHIYENVRPIESLAWHGSQGWKIVDDDFKSKIKFKQQFQSRAQCLYCKQNIEVCKNNECLNTEEHF
jgi:hypothetical protein